MAEQCIKNKTVKGVLWSSVERFSVQGVQFLVMLVIARILDPKDFGLVGMLAIFLAVAQSLIDSGFTQALIRKQDRTEVDNNTVFYFNIVVSVFLYLILFAMAPWVSDFYNEPHLVSLMRVLCLIVIINSFAVVQRALYTALLDFKTQAKASFIAALASGCTGIYLAMNGYGVWTLVWQQLLNAGINTLLLWVFSKWFPQWLYSWQSFRKMFAFGSKLLASGLLDTLYNNLYTLVIGKVFTAASLGYYSQADRFTKLPSSNLTGILQRVTYPVLCCIQDDDERLRNDFRQLLRLSAFIIFPIMCILAGVAYPLVELLLGDKWRFAATLIIPLCFTMMWYPIHAINLNLLQVKGRSDLFLNLELFKKTIGVTIILLSIRFGLVFLCYSGIITSVLCLIFNAYYTNRMIKLGIVQQFKDFSHTLLSSLVIFVLLLLCSNVLNSGIISLCIEILCAMILYVAIALFCRFEEVKYIKIILKR